MPGVFIWALFCCLSPLAAADCLPAGVLEPARVASVIDGDTVKLADGRSVRLIGINAPERGGRDRPGEPLAQRARQALQALLPADGRLFLEPGTEARDRYGRRLAHLYLREDGGNIEAALLRDGMGFHVVVPPNSRQSDCLAAAEAEARRGRSGVWDERHFAPRDAGELTQADAGFRRVRVRVQEVTRNRGGWWIESGQLSLQLSHADRKAFPACVPACWRGRTLVVRGWLVDRSGQANVRERGYPPLLLKLRHPAMVEPG